MTKYLISAYISFSETKDFSISLFSNTFSLFYCIAGKILIYCYIPNKT